MLTLWRQPKPVPVPEKALHLSNSHIESQSTGEKFYIVRVRVTFTNGDTTIIRFNTDENYKTLISAEYEHELDDYDPRSFSTDKTFEELSLWEKQLFDCCKVAKSTDTSQYLFSFEEFKWSEKGIATQEDIQSFSSTMSESKPTCSLL